ncbi:tryptophan 7-halogenase [Sphingomonas sp. Leaf62]|uniref:tryptophan 7-halogenase n=1 Tax=Sphingomonas sp. Leaf62 TaxID=1736228 RepID=UPI001F2BB113|nr:tryptophan 7-halogenase [Sphingomonas sp. Leaf62]
METSAKVGRIMVCGSGLAAEMTVATLAAQLPPQVAIVRVDAGDQRASDLFYGSVTAPSAYAFNLSAGVDERRLILTSDTSFSWGTRYADWGGRGWMQGFALPFPVIDGVQLHQYLALVGVDAITPYVAGIQAARRGVFVHPPRDGDGQHPLVRAEYGYQFDPVDYAALFVAAVPAGRVERVGGTVVGVEVADGAIAGVRLDDGRLLTADLYVDGSGPAAVLLSALAPDWQGTRRIALAVEDDAGTDETPLRTVRATPDGWQSETPLKGRVRRMRVSAAGTGDVAATIGRRSHGWVGNCVGIGQAAAVVEPLTPAPMLLLERDIERLLTLIPTRADMGVEAREYDRRFADDHDHADLFQRAFFTAEGLPDGPYWQAATAEPVPEKLARKLTMFADRGVLVAYDLEPFHPEDWTILHLGLGSRPRRHDRLADRADPGRVRQYLSTMERDIEQAVAKLPPARIYRAQLEQYLKRGMV